MRLRLSKTGLSLAFIFICSKLSTFLLRYNYGTILLDESKKKDRNKNKEDDADASAALAAAPAVANAQAEPIANKQEFIAAVSAAIAEDMGTDISAIRIKSIKKI